MIEGAPWSRVVKEIETIIMTFPSLEGFMIMNDTGKNIVGGGNWVKPTKANRIDAVQKMNRLGGRCNQHCKPIQQIAIAHGEETYLGNISISKPIIPYY